MRTLVLAVVLMGCGSGPELGSGVSGAGCRPPEFTAGECVADVLNDGTGPDDHRTLCHVGGEWWALYPSGETWHWREPDGKSDPVICHSAAGGTILQGSD